MNISNYLKNEAALHEDVDIRYILLLLSFGPQFCHKFFYFLPSLSPCTLCNENENFVHSIAAAWWIDGTA